MSASKKSGSAAYTISAAITLPRMRIGTVATTARPGRAQLVPGRVRSSSRNLVADDGLALAQAATGRALPARFVGARAHVDPLAT